MTADHQQARPDGGLDLIDAVSEGALDSDEAARRRQRHLDEANHRAQLRRYHQQTSQQQIFAFRLFWLVVAWLFFVLVLIVFDAMFSDITVPENVLVVLATTCTTNVLGLFVVVTRHVFSYHPRDQSQMHGESFPAP